MSIQDKARSFDAKTTPDFKPMHVDMHENRIKQGANDAQAERDENAAMQQQEGEEMNPFASQGYGQFNKVPDVPISMGNNMAESLLSDDGVPEHIKEKYWYAFHRDNMLTFLDVERKRQKLLNMDIMKIDMLNQTPYYHYNFGVEFELSLVRNVFETKLDRALGTTSNVKNERTVLQSQFTENKSINEVSQNEVSTTGFFKRLLGRK